MLTRKLMNPPKPNDWNPRAQHVLDDQLAAYDAMRKRCPVAHSDYLWWSLFRHADVMRVLEDHESFSNAASHYLSIPNAMDPPEHTGYRNIVERYFTVSDMTAFAPVCSAVAGALVCDLPRGETFDLMAGLAQPFALRVQCAFMGWPDALHEPLRLWIGKNHDATRAGDRSAMAQIAVEFDGHIKQELALRRDAGEQAANDVTNRLLQERIHGRPLSDEEIVSIVRNWTVGELGTIAASVGILVHYLATHPALQAALRQHVEDLPAAIDEILRLHPPLIASRRVTTCPVEIAGHTLGAGERLTLIWGSANRDEAVFGDPDTFDPERNGENNLLYGAGVHVCPGAPLARLELRVLVEALLANTRDIALAAGQASQRAYFPASGFASLRVCLQ
jgi:cytochrome P450